MFCLHKNGNSSLRPAIHSAFDCKPKTAAWILPAAFAEGHSQVKNQPLWEFSALCVSPSRNAEIVLHPRTASPAPQNAGWAGKLGGRSHRCVLHDSLTISPSEKRSIADPPRQPLLPLIQTVAAPHFRLESLWALAKIVVGMDGLIQLPVEGRSEMLQMQHRPAGGERRLELCLLNAAIRNIHSFGWPGLGSRCAESKAELKAELDLWIACSPNSSFYIPERCWCRGMTAVSEAILYSTLSELGTLLCFSFLCLQLDFPSN